MSRNMYPGIRGFPGRTVTSPETQYGSGFCVTGLKNGFGHSRSQRAAMQCWLALFLRVDMKNVVMVP
ncbi:hypothetical protein [Ottowia thiooxydans]|uniref:Uncharacterized protein n=1 Tax=Ottowia thiooxydans TaxID=219182 RepID=A0ABV2Q6U4_9BURK